MHVSYIVLTLIAVCVTNGSMTFINGRLRQKIVNQLKRKGGTRLLRASEVVKGSCQPKSYNRTISRANCEPVIVNTGFCYGMCRSFYIPGKQTLQSCQCCRPTKILTDFILLNCPQRNERRKIIKTEKIVGCACKNCQDENN